MKPIVAAPTALVAGGLFLAGCTGGGSQPVTYPQEGGQTPPSVPTIVKTWGESGTVDGVRFTVSEPRIESPTNYDGSVVEPEAGKHYVAVDLTVENVGKSTLESPGFSETTTELSPVEGVMTSTTEELPATFLPGDKATSSEYLSVPNKAKELRLETTIGMGALDRPVSAHLQFRGPLPAQEATPAKAPAPTDNCELDPADMDHTTKVQCGLIDPAPVEEAPAEEPMPECGPNATLVPKSPVGPYCDGGGPAVGPPQDTDPGYDEPSPWIQDQLDEQEFPPPGSDPAPGDPGYVPPDPPGCAPTDSSPEC